jgi:hypothetical protein
VERTPRDLSHDGRTPRDLSHDERTPRDLSHDAGGFGSLDYYGVRGSFFLLFFLDCFSLEWKRQLLGLTDDTIAIECTMEYYRKLLESSHVERMHALCLHEYEKGWSLYHKRFRKAKTSCSKIIFIRPGIRGNLSTLEQQTRGVLHIAVTRIQRVDGFRFRKAEVHELVDVLFLVPAVRCGYRRAGGGSFRRR